MNPTPLNDCGCCEGVEAETPAPIVNRSGLSAIAYRCGTHAQFKQSMLAALSSSAHPALSGLATRDDDDFSIALLDAWATTADVLAFYQERIAQESYLRTATERDSLLQLGRLIGYELRPGVAASTYLAFTLETAAGAPTATAIETGTKVQSVPGPGEKPQTFETVEKIEARPEWNEMRVRQTQPQQIDAATEVVYLDGVATQLRKGDALLFLGPDVSTGNRSWDVCRVQSADVEHEKNRTRVTLNDRPVHFTAMPTSSMKVFAMRLRAALFGHNAPDRRVLTQETREAFEEATPGITLRPVHDPAIDLLIPKFPDWNFKLDANALDLDATYPAIVAGSWVSLSAAGKRALGRVVSASEAGRTDFTLTGKVSRLALVAVPSSDSTAIADFAARLRATTVFAESQELKFAEAPVGPVVSGTILVVAQNIVEFARGRVLAITGRDAATGASFNRIVTLVDTAGAGAFTAVKFTPAVPELAVESVRINANVARATHGETVAETLGAADASRPFQRFDLRQTPLTFVRAPGPGGAKSTLQVRVNDVLWHEVPTFFGRGPHDHIFITRPENDGGASVQFGDGVTGARPPSGQDNVRASYRRGIGREGLVKADQLTTLLTRPLGVKGVTNPVAAEGAADPEQLGDARRNAPLTVLTLDRIVSLRDYEDFIRAFAGVAKALATWTWDGEARGVFVTVAGPAGAEIDLSGDFGRNLLGALQEAAVPRVPVRVQSYRKATGLFTITGRVKIDPDHEVERVLGAVRSALETRFSFDARAFGDPVISSEVIATMQSVPGVIAVDVDELRRSDAPAGSPRLNPRLVAAVPQAGTRAAPSPAELLTLAPLAPNQIGVLA